jgi:hypothetical protein
MPGDTPRRDVTAEPREQTVSGGVAQDIGRWPGRAAVADGQATPPQRIGRAQGRAEPRAGGAPWSSSRRHGRAGGRRAAPPRQAARKAGAGPTTGG